MKILAILIVWGVLALLFWSLVAVNSVAKEPPAPIETKAAKAWIEKRMRYHGLSGVVVLRESDRGLEFERDGRKKCLRTNWN